MIQRDRTYTNHLGTELRFDGKVLFMTDTTALFARDYAVNSDGYTSQYSIQPEKEYAIEVAAAGTFAEVKEAVDRLYAVTGVDLMDGEDGSLLINGYRMYGRIKQIQPQTTLPTLFVAQIIFHTSRPMWYRELKTILYNNADVEEIVYGAEYSKEYPYAYPYGYTDPNLIRTINSGSSLPVAFRIVMEGAWTNPTVTIAGHDYSVSTSLQSDEKLVIDSTTKKIYKSRTGRKSTVTDRASGLRL